MSVEAHEAVFVTWPRDRVNEHGAENDHPVQKVGPLQEHHILVKPQIAGNNPRP